MRRKAFTLIELLVVIAIIAILAAVLFPVFTAARAKAEQATCVSNVKNLASALLQYAQDYDQRLVQWWPNCWLGINRWNWQSNIDRARANPPWHVRLNSYLRNYNIHECPSDRREGAVLGTGCLPEWRQFFPKVLSYGYNEQVCSYTTNLLSWIDREERPVSLSNLANFVFPAETFLIGDCFWTLAGAQSTLPDGVVPRVAYPNAWPRLCFYCWSYPASPEELEEYTRHQGGSIIAFADGHAKWFKSRQITLKGLRPWFEDVVFKGNIIWRPDAAGVEGRRGAR